MTAYSGPAPATNGKTGPGTSAAAKLPKLTAESTADDAPVLFDDAGDPSEYLVGRGPRPATTGPEDATAPPWWVEAAERAVLSRIAKGETASSDTLHEDVPDEPSASGAAYGALFARLARAGLIREVGMTRSTRPSARRRRIILWGPAA